ncbi:hypothetical protein DSM100238_1855 [Bifidobacterium apri]|uniref:Uncharacterized protein n=1 Tax=Bifidobacterium apri TaxID=1769423 RepID=A0A6A2VD33_9BIFI|nr:hypothetical protein DSM100238_1855 [Bifidobacterium apri]
MIVDQKSLVYYCNIDDLQSKAYDNKVLVILQDFYDEKCCKYFICSSIN